MMMECAKAKQLAAAALAGDASEGQTHDLDDHLTRCAVCRAEWEALATAADTVRSAAPAAVETGADVVGRALAQGASAPARPRTRALALRMAWVLGVLAVMCAGAVVHFRPGREQGLLAVVEAATEAQPAHIISALYMDFSGELVVEQETWRSPGGDTIVTTRPPGKDPSAWAVRRAGSAVVLGWRREAGHIEVTWERTSEPWRAPQDATHAGAPLPPGVPEDARELIGWMKSLKTEVSVGERTEELDGERVRVITVTAQIPASDMPFHKVDPRYPMEVECWLTRDGKRLRKMVYRSASDGYTRLRTETRLVEYDVPLPENAFPLQLPTGAPAKATFRDQPVELVWETMSEGERQSLRQAFDAWARAWCTGDAEGFLRHMDIEAGLQYGFKGKFTASWLRERWASMVAEQPRRWPQHTLTMDYAVGTSNPPAWAMEFWSIYRTKAPTGPGWLQYRLMPSTEPGIEVLARERVVGPDGKAQELGTMLFMKRINGEYKVLLWAPPFG